MPTVQQEFALSWGYKNWLLTHKKHWLSLDWQEVSPLHLQCPHNLCSLFLINSLPSENLCFWKFFSNLRLHCLGTLQWMWCRKLFNNCVSVTVEDTERECDCRELGQQPQSLTLAIPSCNWSSRQEKRREGKERKEKERHRKKWQRQRKKGSGL